MPRDKRIHCFLVFLFCVSVRFAFWNHFGGARTADTFHLILAQNLAGGSFWDFLKLVSNVPYYAGYPLFLASIKELLGNNNAVAIVQILLSSFAITVFSNFLWKLTGNVWVSLLAVFFIATNYDFVQWDYYLTTDSLFCSLLMFLISSIGGKKWTTWIVPAVLSALLLLTRPVALPLFAMSFLFLLTKKVKESSKLVPILFLAALVTVPVVFSKYRYVPYLLNRYAKGEVIRDRRYLDNFNLDTSPAHPINLNTDIQSDMEKAVNLGRLFTTRAVYFWSFYFTEYSFRNALLKAFYFVPFYLVFLFGLKSILLYPNVGENLSLYLWTICSAASLWIFHIFVFIDFDFRYRIPVLILMTPVACLGTREVSSLLLSAVHWLKEGRLIEKKFAKG